MLSSVAVNLLIEEPHQEIAKRTELKKELAALDADLAQVRARAQNCVDVLSHEGVQGIKPGLTKTVARLEKAKHPILVRRERCRQLLAALGEKIFDRARVSHAFERLGRLLPIMERDKQRQLCLAVFDSIRVSRGRRESQEFTKNEPPLDLCFRIRLASFVEGMERERMIDDRTVRTSPSGKRLLDLDAQVLLSRKTGVKVLTPFQAVLNAEPQPAAMVDESVQHPIHKAIQWEIELERGCSVRALAPKEQVSASLVSFHLKLLRLAPEIQQFARGLSTPAEMDFFSLRKLALLSEMDHGTQLAKFQSLRRRFNRRKDSAIGDAHQAQ
jgi:hypothetical protein